MDFPRLREAGVRVQLFTVATRGFPLVDGMAAFCASQGWPRAARENPRSRALWQIERLHVAAARSGGTAAVALTREDLEENAARGRLSAVLGLEGAYPLEGDPGRLREFWELGVRTLGPAHLLPNAFASCSYWAYRDRGLSEAGRDLVRAMGEIGMALDLAHASPRATQDLLACAPATLPVFNSHTGLRSETPHWRNLDDDAARAIAARGGVIGVILARKYLGDPTLLGFVRHARRALSVAGGDAVAVGSDFDGFVALPRGFRDATDLPRLAPALEAAGVSRAEASAIVGGNLMTFLRRSLPSRHA